MSYRIVADIFDSGLFDNGKLLVLVALGEWSNEEGFCFPSDSLIAFRSRQSARNTRRCLQQLMDGGAIKKGTDGYRNGFWINVGWFRQEAQKELDRRPKTLWHPDNLSTVVKSRAVDGQKRAENGRFSTVVVRPDSNRAVDVPVAAVPSMATARTTTVREVANHGPSSGHLPQRNKEEPPGTTRNRQGTASAATSATPSPPRSPQPSPVVVFPLNDGTGYEVTQQEVDEWYALYPAVDVHQQLRNMRGWLLSNPLNRKTRTGILRFVTTWLAKEQNSARRNGHGKAKHDVATDAYLERGEFELATARKFAGGGH